MKTRILWFITFFIGFFLEWGALYWRRQSILNLPPSPEFTRSFAVYAAITTIFAAVALATLFFIAERSSGITPPAPRPGSALFTWGVLALLALDSNKYGIGEGFFRMDELLVNLDALLFMVCATGVFMALRIESVRTELLGKNVTG